MSEELSERKLHHIQLALSSQVHAMQADTRFSYEPLFGFHQSPVDLSCTFGEKKMEFPLWISSMTGGTELAKSINERLATAAGKYRLGMGLGSCRIILNDKKYVDDFRVRKYIGTQPLYANLGVHQIAILYRENRQHEIKDLVHMLECDGLIIHVNPLQEWLQPEGDRYIEPPAQTIERVLQSFTFPIMVKEVGQGFGQKSLETLLQLPLQAVELAGFGGTNFAKMENLRQAEYAEIYAPTAFVGHSCAEMLTYIADMNLNTIKTKNVIYSGGIRTYLDAFYFLKKSPVQALIAQGSAMLQPAMESQENLDSYIYHFIESIKMSYRFLTVK